MKTRLLIVIGIIVTVFLMGTIVYPFIYETTFDDEYPHDIKTALDNTPPIHPKPKVTDSLKISNADTPEIFSHGSTKYVNPNHESLKYYKTIQVIDDTYLGKNVQQWQDVWDWELESNYNIYKDEFYEELGRLLVKNEITQVMNQFGIINTHDDFKVHQGYSLLSLPLMLDLQL